MGNQPNLARAKTDLFPSGRRSSGCLYCFYSSKKKWKDRLFAAPVNRDETEHAASELGVPLDEHIQIVLDAMKANAAPLGLNSVA
jgi:pyruvate formate-lyase activating enzyme-like uncharacterized protein